MLSRTTNVVSEQGSEHVVIIIDRIRYYYRQNKLIIIAKTRLYDISIKQNKVSEQMRTIIETRSYYSQNKFVCHFEQKQM
jgi:hypothetical protein